MRAESRETDALREIAGKGGRNTAESMQVRRARKEPHSPKKKRKQEEEEWSEAVVHSPRAGEAIVFRGRTCAVSGTVDKASCYGVCDLIEVGEVRMYTAGVRWEPDESDLVFG
ncbi:hypothetical protein HPB50_022096 [Hyalomma asiaticum]|uniref:Uncharacterized protein n=1 Tax=Hyalomma asiaticum TaxID=266040 RepID=A0ACB7TLY3_HYAAI|nr:hypothetical protein HPB50_022096 [Hyalomma asiaticum]